MKRIAICIFHLFVLLSITLNIQASSGREINIEDRGAIGDGVFKNTEIIQSAIDELNQNEGGTIIFPEGTFLTGNITLKSNVGLHIDFGSVLLGSTVPHD